MMDAIPRSNLYRSNGGKKHWKRSLRNWTALSQSKPVLMIFEDVHWIDPTSLEALESDRGPDQRHFVCC